MHRVHHTPKLVPQWQTSDSQIRPSKKHPKKLLTSKPIILLRSSKSQTSTRATLIPFRVRQCSRTGIRALLARVRRPPKAQNHPRFSLIHLRLSHPSSITKILKWEVVRKNNQEAAITFSDLSLRLEIHTLRAVATRVQIISKRNRWHKVRVKDSSLEINKQESCNWDKTSLRWANYFQVAIQEKAFLKNMQIRGINMDLKHHSSQMISWLLRKSPTMIYQVKPLESDSQKQHLTRCTVIKWSRVKIRVHSFRPTKSRNILVAICKLRQEL